MCGSMADIQSVAAEIRRGKKKEERREENKRQDENIMSASIPQGDHNNEETCDYTSDAPDETRDGDDDESGDGRERHNGLTTCR